MLQRKVCHQPWAHVADWVYKRRGNVGVRIPAAQDVCQRFDQQRSRSVRQMFYFVSQYKCVVTCAQRTAVAAPGTHYDGVGHHGPQSPVLGYRRHTPVDDLDHLPCNSACI
jgi:hypothetical protein